MQHHRQQCGCRTRVKVQGGRDREWIETLEEHVDFTNYVSTGDGMWVEGFKEGVYTNNREMTIGLVCALSPVPSSVLHGLA